MLKKQGPRGMAGGGAPFPEAAAATSGTAKIPACPGDAPLLKPSPHFEDVTLDS